MSFQIEALRHAITRNAAPVPAFGKRADIQVRTVR